MRPHQPVHKLSSVHFDLRLSATPGDHDVVLRVAGRSVTRRADLWTYEEAFGLDSYAEQGYGPSDAMAHVALVAIQDRPNSLARLHFALNGGLAWEEQQLF